MNNQIKCIHDNFTKKNTACTKLQERTADEPSPQINTQSMIAKLIQTPDEVHQAV